MTKLLTPFRYLKYLYVKYWRMRGSPIAAWNCWSIPKETRKEILRNGWHD